MTDTAAGIKKKAILFVRKFATSSTSSSFTIFNINASNSKTIPKIAPGMNIILFNINDNISPSTKNNRIINICLIIFKLNTSQMIIISYYNLIL
jgi:hypothetical protein